MKHCECLARYRTNADPDACPGIEQPDPVGQAERKAIAKTVRVSLFMEHGAINDLATRIEAGEFQPKGKR